MKRVERLAPAERDELVKSVRKILEIVGEDLGREGLKNTPKRVAESLEDLTRGYTQDPKQVLNGALFKAVSDDMVIVKDIDFYALCEHHLLPFFGKVHIAYLPAGKIIGLSKLPRLVEIFARRFQVQERMTHEIAKAVHDLLEARGVGVVVEAQHLCMMMRGVEKQNSYALTSCMLGRFRTDGRTRGEFLGLLRHGRISV
ncbi:MAG: GTP cyclohydrolase I FolE [Planctomycetes bacterium]|nr:GTP cyclohydrolase I FolE [Planctomycetota bacterium]